MDNRDEPLALDDLLACPRCGKAPLEANDNEHRCAGCKTGYPAVEAIPWLFAEPDAALGEWRHRLQLSVQQLAHESKRIAAELKKATLLDATRDRLERLRDAIEAHRRNLLELLAPLDVQSMQASYESHLALRTRLPGDQGLNTYYNNVHRDWVWGDAENAASIEQIEAALARQGDPATGDAVVLGAGAGRLAWDLHRREGATRTVAVDFNPLLFLIAKRMYAGESLELYEFPIAPSSSRNVARLQTLSAPEAADAGLHLVLADVLRPPFAVRSFDTVVTPWLIDILSEDLRVFAARINQLLKPGGRWITFGSLAFEGASRARRYSPEEIIAIAAEAGFGEPAVVENRIPYMCSPLSRHGRQELVFTLAAAKEKKVKAPERHKALPDWIVTGREPVPLLKSFQTQAMSTRIYAFIMSLIDGRRSIEDMANILEQQNLMPKSEAVTAIRNFMIRMYEDSRRNPNF
jgi:uncharacterized protein YbaR (Trm112 family)